MADGNVPTVTNDSDIANVFRSHHGIRASKDLRMYKFDGKDYHLWSFAMKGYLRSQGLCYSRIVASVRRNHFVRATRTDEVTTSRSFPETKSTFHVRQWRPCPECERQRTRWF